MYGREVIKTDFVTGGHLSSPTYSYGSHQRWALNYAWTLTACGIENPFDAFATIFLNKSGNKQVADFSKALNKSILNNNFRNKLNQSYFGVFDFTENHVLHIHLLFRNIPKDQIIEFLKRYNLKKNTKFNMPYYEQPQSQNGPILYSLKIGKPIKHLFHSGALNRYTIRGGNFFNGKAKQYLTQGKNSFFEKLDHKES